MFYDRRSYLTRLADLCIEANQKALAMSRAHKGSARAGYAKAWDNVKGKNCKKFLPRGKAYARLVKLERDADWAKFKLETDALAKLVQSKAEG